MRSSETSATAAGEIPPAPGRPQEIEEPTNRYLVHPLSRALVSRLVTSPVTPNQVSFASVAAAAAAAGCYFAAPWPWAALGGVALQFVWHVLDGADGDLARRTGRASPIGELVDGVCDHLSQAILYLAFGAILERQMGPLAWVLAGAAALSHFVQANAYETGRKTYRRWVYDAGWMRQSVAALEQKGAAQGALGALYLRISSLTDAGEGEVEAAMAGPLAAGQSRAAAARRLYAGIFAPVVRSSFWLSGNTRTMAAFLSMLIPPGSPAWFFLFETTALNLVLVWLVASRRRRNAALFRGLAQLA
ncbi:MAG TPA: CDP-alcohol phosphatidyltransferase family protein [Caulobacteraceae bacterium]